MPLSSVRSWLFGSNPASNSTDTTATTSSARPSVPEEDASHVLTLPDGRKLGYAQFGLSTGQPIFYCHGLPGSRVEGGHLHDAARQVGARIIATDRPGMGLSSPQPGRTLLDHPKDLEHLAAHLELREYGVLGVSGGGPYALACAASMAPERLKCVSVVCGIGPPDIGMSGAGWLHWLGFTLGWRYAPRVSAWYLRRDEHLELSYEKRLERRLEEAERNKATFPEQELGIWLDVGIVSRMVRASREAHIQGIDGVSHDGHLVGTDFGFLVKDIRPDLPLRLWYGKNDTFVPMNHGVQITKRLGDSGRLRIEDDTHASIFFRWRKEVLADMVKNM